MLNYVEYGKENKYDDNIFFQKYSQMSRSQQGLAGAGEWEFTCSVTRIDSSANLFLKSS